MYDKKFMLEAIRVANENIENQGGPFGAVIVKDGSSMELIDSDITKTIKGLHKNVVLLYL